MSKRNIIVIGASAGGFEVLKTIAAGLPADLDAAVFIVWHMSPDTTGILPQVLNRYGPIEAANVHHREEIRPGRIYVAPPDYHMLLEEGFVYPARGPKENRFRPAIDPLFRSAAYVYGNRVIGVILSGGLDDGVSGLWTIKQAGGIAIVQDPADARVSSMPEHAIDAVDVDYSIPAEEIASLLVRLSGETVSHSPDNPMKSSRLKAEVDSAAEKNGASFQLFKEGKLTPVTCPECGGVLAQMEEGGRLRYRCHTGHSFSSDSLLLAVGEQIEHSFYQAVRSVEEGIMLLNQLGDYLAEANNPKLAAAYFNKAREEQERATLLRSILHVPEEVNEGFQPKQNGNGGKNNGSS